ncbi:retrovirus-related pol polyprotein from transposon TNT 1-94 [Tanacetum coccineum]
MIRYSALCDNDKQHRKKIDEQEILFDKMSRQLVEMNNNVLRLQEKILEKETKISELEECVRNKDLEIEKCLERLNDCENKLHKIGQTSQTIHMIMPSKDKMYNGRKGIGFENPSYFCKAKDLRPSLYDERVIGLGYTPMFLTHSDGALEIEKFKKARDNKIKFAYDYGNLNASYVNEKINFLDDYFQEIINPDFEKIDSLFQQTSSLKPYTPTVILEKIIIDLEDEVVSLLEKEKENLEIIESLKSKGSESSANAISESENQSEHDCHVVEKGCDNLENSKVIARGMFKINVSQSVSPISAYKHLDTLSSVRRPKHSSFIWKKKGSSNTSNIDLSSVSHSKLNKDVKRYSRKDLLTCNNSHHVDTRSAYACNDATNVSCNFRLYASCDVHDLFVFDDKTQVNLQLQVQRVRTDNGTEFKNKTLAKFFDEVGITQQFSAARTPQQNGVVERRNRTLVKAARTMLTFANLPLFLWAEAIATACFTQNHVIYSMIMMMLESFMAKWDIGVFVDIQKESLHSEFTINESKDSRERKFDFVEILKNDF